MPLSSLGLTQSQEDTYRRLLRVGACAVQDLATGSGLDPDLLTPDLVRLHELGLVERSAGDWLEAVPPDVAVDHLIEVQERRIEQERAQLSESRAAVGELVSEFLAAHVSADGEGSPVERIDEGRVVRSRLYAMSIGARTRTRTMVPGDSIPEVAVESALRLDRSLLHRGVRVQTIVSETAATVPHFRTYLETIEAEGACVRVHQNPPALMVIVDDAVVVPLGNGQGGAYIVHGGELIAPMDSLFDLVWQDAAALTKVVAESTSFSEARLRQVIGLLATGQKDESIARRLGVSTRTVRRMVAEAISMLGADSRFQAGVLAAQQGWLGPEPTGPRRRSAEDPSPAQPEMRL